MDEKCEESVPAKQDTIATVPEKEIKPVNTPGGTTGGYLPRTWEVTPEGDFLEIGLR